MTNNTCYRTVTRRRSRGRKGGRWRREVREEEGEGGAGAGGEVQGK